MVLGDAVEERARCGSEQRAPTRRVTWTLTATTWSCRCRGGKEDPCLQRDVKQLNKALKTPIN